MHIFKHCCLFIIFMLLLTGCAAQDKAISHEQISIEPYNISEKESLLISKTGVGNIEFFKLNGTLAEADDLQFSVEVYEKGKLKEELLKSWGVIEKSYRDTLLSFGISDFNENHPFKLLSGIPSGLATTTYPINVTIFSFNNLIDKKITLTKNKPVYLVAWLGTSKNELGSAGSENGELPAGLEEAELSFVYKVLWTDQGTE
ncbi:hypothetical protein ACIQXI_04790 [Lysinibacillus sp. NPDC097195]|uniref:hypothetical protein n=1 Tax=Lysinibacillus sp. NPDC097195 TaxID=3364141 RepID=UPI0038181BB5